MTEFTEILLVEDNEVDVWLTEEALRESGAKARLHLAKDGQEALDFLRKTGPFQQAATPDIIFLDLKLPVLDGIEVLRIIKTDTTLRHIPVIILTTSSHDKDVEATYEYQANAYLNKPIDVREFAGIIEYQHLFKPSNGHQHSNTA